MSEARLCPECAAPIATDALFGLCQTCLLSLASDSPAPPDDAAGEGRTVLAPSSLATTRRQRVGDFEFVRQIGRGGMGVVYEVVQLSLNRHVALKMILDAQVDSPSARRRFTIEAEAVAKLDHPNIVPIYEIGDHEGHPYLSLKLIEGFSLKEKILRGEYCLANRGAAENKADFRSREMAIARLTTIIARAVQHAHEHGVLHRDLKPANILIDPSGQPHLTDFGLAKILDQRPSSERSASLTVSGNVLGTPSYMSPEQATGRPVEAASDTYSLGAVFYEMLTGQPPFRAATAFETIRMVAEQQVRRPRAVMPALDRDLEIICLRCLEKDPLNRYPSAAELAEDIDRWLKQEPIHARPAGPVTRVSRWMLRNRLAACLILSLCAGLAVALGLLQTTNAQRERLETMRRQHMQKISSDVDELWFDTNRLYVPIPSENLAVLANLEPRLQAPHTQHLIYGMRINQEPAIQAYKYAPLLRILEDRISAILHRSVAIDIRLYKMTPGADQPVARGDVHLQRMGAIAYVRAKQFAPSIQPLLREKTVREAVLYARADAGITSLSQVKGHRVGFAHTNSTISFMAKVLLARQGITARQLEFYRNIDFTEHLRNMVYTENRVSQATERLRARYPSDEDDIEGMAHRELTLQVLEGIFDVGQAQRRVFEMNKNRYKGLVEIMSYVVPSDVHVASPALPPDVAAAFQKAMLSFQSPSEKELIASLQLSIIEGYEPAKDSDYDGIRSDLATSVAEFEGWIPAAQANR